MNAMDAMTESGKREVIGYTSISDDTSVEISIADGRIVDPFFTTKENGMGMVYRLHAQLSKLMAVGPSWSPPGPAQPLGFLVRLPTAGRGLA